MGQKNVKGNRRMEEQYRPKFPPREKLEGITPKDRKPKKKR